MADDELIEDKRFALITSMNLPYYEHCGKLMIKSFERYWRGVSLYCYNEGFAFKTKRWKHMNWSLGADYDDFVNRWSTENRKVTTFGKKAFSIIHAMEHIDCDWLIWADADSEATVDMPTQLLDIITDDKYLSIHFGVKHTVDNKTYFSCETGYFMLNKNHPMFTDFKNTYKSIYVNDDYKNLRRFYDGEVYGETVLRLQEQGAEVLDLNKGWRHKTPIPRSVLGPYISHYKAGVKDTVNFDEKLEELE